MTHTQANIIDIELGVIAGIALLRWLIGVIRRS